MASENGWEPSHAGPDILEWRTVPGTNPPVHLQVMKGWPSAVMIAYAADYNAYIEPLRDADSASFTPTNSVATSNHLNGTAMDLNWNDHPFRVSNAGYDPAKQARMRELLAFYNFKGVQIMWWANDWNSPKDAMHHQMGYNTWMNPVVQEFINERIRPDGFSTYKRGGNVSPPAAPPKPSVMTVPLTQKPNRFWTSPSPAWAHLITRESGGNPTIIQQIHDVNSGGNEAEGLFQITPRTWRAHHGDEFAPSPRLATPQQQAIVAARIFTRNPSGSDWGAGLPGREDAKQLAAGLVPDTETPTPVQGEDQLSAEAERMIRELYNEYQANRHAPSRSFFAKDQQWGESPLGFQWNMDGNINELYMTWGYLLGVTSIESAVESIAANGVAPESWAGSMDWLAEVGQQWCQGLIGLRKAMQTAFRAGQPAAQVDTSGLSAENAWLRAENARLQATQVVHAEPATAELAQVAQLKQEPAAGSTGEIIGKTYDALEQLRLADALPIESRAPLAALISVLQTKNGSDIK